MEENQPKKFDKVTKVALIGGGISALGCHALFQSLNMKKEEVLVIDDVSKMSVAEIHELSETLRKNSDFSLPIIDTRIREEQVPELCRVVIENSYKDWDVTYSQTSYLDNEPKSFMFNSPEPQKKIRATNNRKKTKYRK